MKTIVLVLLLIGAPGALADCMRPAAPTLPDGEVADLAAMVEGQKAVKVYVADSEDYRTCLTAMGEALAEEEPPEDKLARIDEYNSSVDETKELAEQFNKEIRDYKDKNK